MARAFSVTSHDIGDPDDLCFSICFSRLGWVRLSFRGLFGPASMCVCACVYLKRTVVSDLHYWRRTRVARLTTLCEILVLRANCWKTKGLRMTFLTICVFLLFNFRRNSFGRGSLIQVIGLSLDFRCLQLDCRLYQSRAFYFFLNTAVC